MRCLHWQETQQGGARLNSTPSKEQLLSSSLNSLVPRDEQQLNGEKEITLKVIE